MLIVFVDRGTTAFPGFPPSEVQLFVLYMCWAMKPRDGECVSPTQGAASLQDGPIVAMPAALAQHIAIMASCLLPLQTSVQPSPRASCVRDACVTRSVAHTLAMQGAPPSKRAAAAHVDVGEQREARRRRSRGHSH